MSKVIKQMQMDDIRNSLKDVRDLVLLQFDKLNSQGEYLIRKNLREKKIRLKQVKNTLTRRVFKELNLQVPDDSPYWAKPTILAWGSGSIKELSLSIDSEIKNPKNASLYREKVTVKGAIADGQAVAFDVAKTMPTRLALLGQIVGMILGPASQIAGCLTGPVSQVASQVQQISEKKEETPVG